MKASKMLNYTNKIYVSNTSNIIYRSISSSVSAFQKVSITKRDPSTINENSPQEELLSSAVQIGKVPSVTEWSTLKSSILSQGRHVTNVDFDAKAIGFCVSHRNYEAGKTFVKFIELQNERLNLAAVGKFMRLYYVCNEGNNNVDKEEEEGILAMYKTLKKEYPVLAYITAENIIHALSITREWKECLLLLDNIKLTATPSAATFSAVIKAAFVNKDFDLGWKLMDEMISNERLPLPFVYNSWLQEILTQKKDILENINQLFSYLANNDIHPAREVTDNLLTVLKPLSYIGSYTSMSNKGICHSCKQPLDKIKLDKDEFDKLKTVFMKNVIVGKNLFNKSTPEELDKFKQFVEKMGNVDMVIDGLNVAYSAGTKQNSTVYAKMVANVVNHFRQQNKKILVLGRIHMYKWPKQYMKYIESNADLFLAQNLSQDDPYLLYATMASGLGTCFLSRDFMRGHAYLMMETNLRKLFRRWQQLHQHSLTFVENNGKVHIKSPFPILPTLQTHKYGWHIPYTNNHTANPPASLDPPKNWLSPEEEKPLTEEEENAENERRELSQKEDAKSKPQDEKKNNERRELSQKEDAKSKPQDEKKNNVKQQNDDKHEQIYKEETYQKPKCNMRIEELAKPNKNQEAKKKHTEKINERKRQKMLDILADILKKLRNLSNMVLKRLCEIRSVNVPHRESTSIRATLIKTEKNLLVFSCQHMW
ncbi:mulder [Carabus blaptoides fortunei]